MKIGILTLPLHTNYGGLLQNFALQQALKQLGCCVYTIDIQIKKSLFAEVRTYVSLLLKHNRLRKNGKPVFPGLPNSREIAIIRTYTNKFIKENISTTRPYFVSDLKGLRGFDAIIVGSDQVWRKAYCPDIRAFFLGFLKPTSKVRRIAYAASFGVDHLEYNQKTIRMCSKLVERFDAISVREYSGVALFRKYFGMSPAHLVDPTLLLGRNDYLRLLNLQGAKPKGSLTTYVLDESSRVSEVVAFAEKELGLMVNRLGPKKHFSKKNRSQIDQCVYPPVEDWIRGFYDADFVITDSFHGTVFSIIFQKPFVAIGNSERGLSRFKSLLSKLGLASQLYIPSNDFDQNLLSKKIDYSKVNFLLDKWRSESIDFIKSSLASK